MNIWSTPYCDGQNRESVSCMPIKLEILTSTRYKVATLQIYVPFKEHCLKQTTHHSTTQLCTLFVTSALDLMAQNPVMRRSEKEVQQQGEYEDTETNIVFIHPWYFYHI